MKKKIKIITFVILILMILIPINRAFADAGWDGSYDGGGYSDGGSYGGGGWDYSDSWSHHSSSGGSSSASYLDPGFIFAFLIVLVIIIYSSIIIEESLKNKSHKVDNPPMITEDKIKEILPDFSMNEFSNKAFEIYKVIQMAWMNFDYETIKKYTTDELFNLYKSQLEVLKIKKQQNIMKAFELFSCSIIGLEHNNKEISLKTRLTIECYDYVVDSNGQTIRGNDHKKVRYIYEMTFIKGKSDRPNTCPNCHAPLDNEVTTICSYCRTHITNESHNWVLSKKQVLSQSSNKKI